MILLHLNIYIYFFNLMTLRITSNASVITTLMYVTSRSEGLPEFLFTLKQTKFGCGHESLVIYPSLP